MSGLTLHSIAQALGGKVVGRSVRCPGPGHSSSDDSLAVSLANNEDGFAVYSFAGDDFRDSKDYVRRRLGLNLFNDRRRDVDVEKRKDREADRQVAVEEERRLAANKLSSARRVWKAASAFEGSLAERYLVSRLCGFAIPDSVYEASALRCTPLIALPRFLREVGEGAAAVMVALMTDPVTGCDTGIHMTFITSDGTNLKERRGTKLISVRRMWGRHGVIRLCPDAEVERMLAIGEGIESCLAGHLLRGGPPVWSAIGAGGVSSFPVLAGIEHLLIFTDNDRSATGEKRAEECRRRWEDKGRFVVLEMPPDTGSDFNDFLISLKRESSAA